MKSTRSLIEWTMALEETHRSRSIRQKHQTVCRCPADALSFPAPAQCPALATRRQLLNETNVLRHLGANTRSEPFLLSWSVHTPPGRPNQHPLMPGAFEEKRGVGFTCSAPESAW